MKISITKNSALFDPSQCELELYGCEQGDILVPKSSESQTYTCIAKVYKGKEIRYGSANENYIILTVARNQGGSGIAFGFQIVVEYIGVAYSIWKILLIIIIVIFVLYLILSK